jgi:hypothetical protein
MSSVRGFACVSPAILACGLAVAARLGAATYAVDRPDDPSLPVPTACTPAPLDCSLRGAILRANAEPDDDLVRVAAGDYFLEVHGSPEDAGLRGDLDLTAPVRIVGEGFEITMINGDGIGGRVFDIQASAITAAIEGVTIYNAIDSTGAGLRCRGGSLTLHDVRIVQNLATQRGGGLEIAQGCQAGATGLDLLSNDAVDEGGGAYVEGALELVRSRIRENDAGSLGGGISSRGGFVTIQGSELWQNEAVSGGGLFLGRSATSTGFLLLEDATLADNAATNGSALRISQVGAQLRHVTFGPQGGASATSVHASGTAAHPSVLFVWNSIFVDPCLIGGAAAGITSHGGNLEVSGASCELDHASDQPGVTAAELDLLGFGNHGGDTQTIALGPASVARSAAPGSCTARDQRWAPRGAAPCDAGAFEDRPGFLFADDFESAGTWFWSSALD